MAALWLTEKLTTTFLENPELRTEAAAGNAVLLEFQKLGRQTQLGYLQQQCEVQKAFPGPPFLQLVNSFGQDDEDNLKKYAEN